MRHQHETALWTHENARLEPDDDPTCEKCGDQLLVDTDDACESCGTPRPEPEIS